jgi:predicted MFS family arabinose efflux permease
MLGDRITELALPLTALSIMGASALEVAVLSGMLWLPALLSVFVGAWVDRQPWRRRILVASDVGRAGLLALVPILHVFGGLSMVALYIVAFGIGCGSVIFAAASPSYFVSLVEPKDYVRANSRVSGSGAITYVVGPAASGWLIALLTAPNAFIVDAASFLVSAALIARSRAYRSRQPKDGGQLPVDRPVFQESFQALLALARHSVLRPVLITTAGMNLANTAILGILTTFLSRTLAFSSGEIGLIFAIAGMGGVLAAVLANTLARLAGVGVIISLSAVGFNLPFGALFWVKGDRPLPVLVLGLIGATAMFCVVLYDVRDNAVIMSVMQDCNRGKLIGAFTTVNYGVRPVGSVIGGALVSVVGFNCSFLALAVGGSLLASFLIFSRVSRLRSVDEANDCS